MVANAQLFVNYFADGQDELGLITFMSGSHVDYAPTLYFKSSATPLTTVIGQLVCGGDTGSAEALTMAYQQIVALNQPGRLNVIVFFTDGNPNGITIGGISGVTGALLAPIKTLQDQRYAATPPFSLTTVPASPCPTLSLLSGAIAQESGNATATSGYTSGLYSPVGPSISTGTDTLIQVPGCWSSSNVNYPQTYIRNDLAYIPTADSYGNSTTGAPVVNTDYFASGPYAGQIRPDVPVTIVHASTSAAYAAAATIHNDANFNILIYAIGLGDTNLNDPVNSAFLSTIANDPTAASQYGGTYNPSYPQGLYVYSPSITQLASAYATIAAQVLRLSQ
jgi:hypothetical protein